MYYNGVVKKAKGGAAVNPYEKCPVYETEHFHLRLVKLKDAADLLECYKHPTSAVQGSAANCYVGPGGYGSQKKRDMRKFIRMWLDEYRNREFVRWSVIGRQSGLAVGSIEMFCDPSLLPGCRGGVLRIDLIAFYETELYVAELLRLVVDEFYTLFDADVITTNGHPEAEIRLRAIAAAGFVPIEWPGRENYYGRKAAP